MLAMKGDRLTDRAGNTICYAARDIPFGLPYPVPAGFFERWVDGGGIEVRPDAPFFHDTGLNWPVIYVDGKVLFDD